MVSITLWLFFSPGKELGYIWAEVGPVTDLGVSEKGKISYSYWDLNLGLSGAQSRDSSVSIATHYGLDGPGIESR